jgi:hypothetical protein
VEQQIYSSGFYWDNDGLDNDQVYTLLITREQREPARIERV